GSGSRAGNCVVNLNGHTISGQVGNFDSGVKSDSHAGTVVKNGTIKGFNIAVEYDSGIGGLVSKISSRSNATAVDLCGTSDTEVRGLHASNGQTGVGI